MITLMSRCSFLQDPCSSSSSLAPAFGLSSENSKEHRRRRGAKCRGIQQLHSASGGQARIGFSERFSFGGRTRTRPFCRSAFQSRNAATSTDYYQVLGVNKAASKQEIKASYRRLAREFHPDVNKAANAEDKFKEISAAYEVLSDEAKRSVYDKYGEDGLKGGGPAYSDNPFDIFDSFFGGRSGFGKRAESWAVQGNDVSYDLSLDFKEAVFGVQKQFEIWHLESCELCNGSGSKSKSRKKCRVCGGVGEVMRTQETAFGMFSQVSTCTNCGGDGEVISDHCRKCGGKGGIRAKQTVKIDIPCGVDSGNTFRVAGAGDVGERGGPAGDLYVNLKVRDLPGIRRDGINLHSEITVSYTDCILGATKKVKTLEGFSDLHIPSGTQPGDTLVLLKLGVPKLRRPTVRGDHLFLVKVLLPTKVSDTEKELVEELARLEKDPHRLYQARAQQKQKRA